MKIAIILISSIFSLIVSFTSYYFLGVGIIYSILIFLSSLAVFLYIGLNTKALKKTIRIRKTDEEVIEAIEYVREWWGKKLGTGEDFRVEESEGFEFYIGQDRYYAISISRYGVENKMIVIVGTNPLRIISWLPYSSIYYSSPMEVIKKVYGINPTPAPTLSPREIREEIKEEPKRKQKDDDLRDIDELIEKEEV